MMANDFILMARSVSRGEMSCVLAAAAKNSKNAAANQA
jgi:hypothetical protein